MKRTGLIYQFIHDQSLLYINQGLTENEVAHANQLVFADPKNQEARNLCADALEQLAYQAESGTWRNVYLSGAKDLREGSKMDNQYSYKGKSLSPAEALR